MKRKFSFEAKTSSKLYAAQHQLSPSYVHLSGIYFYYNRTRENFQAFMFMYLSFRHTNYCYLLKCVPLTTWLTLMDLENGRLRSSWQIFSANISSLNEAKSSRHWALMWTFFLSRNWTKLVDRACLHVALNLLNIYLGHLKTSILKHISVSLMANNKQT
jgi:hypothetical protein